MTPPLTLGRLRRLLLETAGKPGAVPVVVVAGGEARPAAYRVVRDEGVVVRVEIFVIEEDGK